MEATLRPQIAPAEGQSSVVSVDVPDMLPLRACATFKLSLTKPVDCEASFELDEAVLGQNVPLLVTLRAGPGFSIGVEIAALKLKFGETHEEISVVPAASSDGVWLADTVVTSSSSQTVTVRPRFLDKGSSSSSLRSCWCSSRRNGRSSSLSCLVGPGRPST